jgi:hypothetical protein
LPSGYALPKKNIIKIINVVCLRDNIISLKKDQELARQMCNTK